MSCRRGIDIQKLHEPKNGDNEIMSREGAGFVISGNLSVAGRP